jgi:hypothetical protein
MDSYNIFQNKTSIRLGHTAAGINPYGRSNLATFFE